MNRKVTIILLVLSILGCYSCDVIDENDRVLPVDLKDLDVSQTVMLEDFTGVYCNNCPNAAATAQSIQATLKEQLVVVSIHAGVFATQEFKTEAGTAYQERFYPENKAYPAGMISRTSFDGSLIRTDFSKWNAYILERLQANLPVILKLSLQPNYHYAERSVDVTTTIQTLSPVMTDLKLQLWLTESHIISPQLSKEGMILDYEHNHVLRDAVNGIWGEDVVIQANETKEYTCSYTLKDINWIPENMHVVGFVYDAKTMQVLYATEIPLMLQKID